MTQTPKMASITSHSFAQVPRMQIPRSKFRKPFTHKSSFDAGWLIPFYTQEILPGDVYNFNAEHVIRIATLLHPVMSNLYVDFHWFFVPNRLVWSNWQKFCGEQENPDDSIDYLVPQLDVEDYEAAQGSIYDYLNLPTKTAWPSNLIAPNALILRAHNLIWNYWFRDQNLQDSLPVPMGDGPDDPALYELVKRGKRKDYITAALPWPQKGDAVTLPLGTTAPIHGDGQITNVGWAGTIAESAIFMAPGGLPVPAALSAANISTPPPIDPQPMLFGQQVGLVADLSDASAATINALRQAFAVQGILELYARGGTRYMEILKSQWGVIAHDYRLQYPEFLGYSSSGFTTVTVPQTSQSETGNPQASLAAYGVQITHSRYNKSFVEHGHVIGFISVRGDLMYQNQLHKMWTRRTRWDFAQPQLANLGEQAVLNHEVKFSGNDTLDTTVFGYMPRFDEYRSGRTLITDLMRSNADGSLQDWHLAYNFETVPALNGSFIEENPPVNRVIAVEGLYTRQFIMDCVGQEYALMSLPVNSTPALLDRM